MNKFIKGYIMIWLKSFLITSGFQVLLQILTISIGIILIRYLSKYEYALYTLSISMWITLNSISDGGINNTILNIGSKFWRDDNKMGDLITTSLFIRIRLALLSLLFISPLFTYLFVKQNYSWFEILVCEGLVIILFFASLTTNLYDVILKLKNKIIFLQKTQFANQLIRAILILVFITLLPYSFSILLIMLISQILINRSYKLKIENDIKYKFKEGKVDNEMKSDLLSNIKKILPGTVYYAFYGQLSVFLISLIGSTDNIAEIGALSRLALVLGVLSNVFSVLLLPKFSKIMDINKVSKAYFFINIFFILTLLFICLIIYVYPDIVLIVLGPKFLHLKREALLIACSSSLNVLSGIAYQLAIAKGFIINPLLTILINTLMQVFLILLLDLSSINGVLTFNILCGVQIYLTLVIYFLVKFQKEKNAYQ